MKRLLLWLCLLLTFTPEAAGQRPASTNNSARPNIIFILIDDLRWDELGISGHPYIKTPNIDRIGKEGAMFLNAFVTTPLCSPSRAGFLTGQYAHTNGITDNVDRSAASHRLVTFPSLLHQSGYETAFIGKWHMGNDDTPRPGFDRWISFKGQGTYLNPDINEDGRAIKPTGYITDILSGYAVEFIRRPHSKPFLVYLAHKAIHPEVTQNNDGSVNLADSERFIPAERHRSLHAGKAIPHRPNYKRAPEGKPALQRQIGNLPPLGSATATRDETILGRQRSLMAIEDSVGEILKALKETGRLDDTVIVFTSDNGYFYGEHGLSVERRLAYEESIRMPLLVRYPKRIKPGTVRDEFALNIDLAPTLLALAGAPVPDNMEGRSLVPLLKGQKPAWRNSFLIEYYSDKVFPRMVRMGYKAVRNQRWKYIHYLELDGMDELYNLKSDPYELKNLINFPAAARARDRMKRELERYYPVKAMQSPDKWVVSWVGSVQGPYPAGNPSMQPDLKLAFPSAEAGARDQSFRLIVKPEIWGRQARLRFSNVFGTRPVTFDGVFLGLHQASSAIVSGTNRRVTFEGKRSVTISPGESAWSDAIALPFVRNPASSELAGRKLAVSFHIPGESGPMTWHAKAMQTSYLTRPGAGSRGDDESEADFPLSTTSWYFLDALEMKATAGAYAILAFGDSITDGTLSTLNGDDRWPDVLARRLHTVYGNRVSVVNAGIGGNQVVGPKEYTPQKPYPGGPSASERLERDVLSLSGVAIVIWLEGINDISRSGDATIEAVQAGMKEAVRRIRARIRDVRVIGATLTPALGATNPNHGFPEQDRKRKLLNQFIRTSGVFDGVADFDRAITDPAIGAMKAEFVHNTTAGGDGDKLHPNRLGYIVMGLAIDLDLVRPAGAQTQKR
jgi:arylsulfatase A-like enzyme/lysophospholipase L1-like esterase